MARTSPQPWAGELWNLVKRQHGVVTRAQLLDLGLSREAIQHRIERGRLHPLRRGIYAVGRPAVEQPGRWMAAVLSCGHEALLGHRSAGALWGILERAPETIEVVVPARVDRRPPGVRVHRRSALGKADRDSHRRIPVTTPAATLIDLATQLGDAQLKRAINASDRLGLIDPETLRAAVDSSPRRPGIGRLWNLLDRHTFRSTDSELERRFLRLLRNAGLPEPLTQVNVDGFRVDFYWPDLGLVVETDGLLYHRTPSQQARDLLREQTHAAAGTATLRFTAAQIRDETARVLGDLGTVIDRLESSR